jgi:hypothetical protein
VEVTVDPGADDVGGVYIGWRRRGEDACDPGHPHGRGLRAEGESPNDLAVGVLYVTRPPRESLLERLGLDSLRAAGAR